MDLRKKEEEVRELEKRVRGLLRSLEKGRGDLEGLVKEGKKVRKGIEGLEDGEFFVIVAGHYNPFFTSHLDDGAVDRDSRAWTRSGCLCVSERWFSLDRGTDIQTGTQGTPFVTGLITHTHRFIPKPFKAMRNPSLSAPLLSSYTTRASPPTVEPHCNVHPRL